MNSIYLSRRLAAKWVCENFGIRCSEKWLAKLAVTGGGPKYCKNGRAVLYRRDHLEAWVAGRIKGPWKSSSDQESNAPKTSAPFSYLRSGTGLPFVDA
jgi:hypothetical protein